MSQVFNQNIVLETERLVLRFIDKKDEDAIFENVFHDKEALKYYIAEYKENREEFSIDKLIDYSINTQRYMLAIILKEDGKCIGMIHQCSTPDNIFRTSEIGYVLGSNYWHKGYATESLKAFINYLFEIGIHKVFCGHIIENAASGKVMQKVGMIYEGTKVHDIYYHDKYWDCNYYYLINPKEKF